MVDTYYYAFGKIKRIIQPKQWTQIFPVDVS